MLLGIDVQVLTRACIAQNRSHLGLFGSWCSNSLRHEDRPLACCQRIINSCKRARCAACAIPKKRTQLAFNVARPDVHSFRVFLGIHGWLGTVFSAFETNFTTWMVLLILAVAGCVGGGFLALKHGHKIQDAEAGRPLSAARKAVRDTRRSFFIGHTIVRMQMTRAFLATAR